MSEKYIKNHFEDIKGYANIIENRLYDESLTMESVLEDNTKTFALVKKYNANHTLIDDKYEIIIDLQG